MQRLKTFLTKPNNSNETPLVIWMITFFCIIAYFLPWISHQSTSLTLGAYDLAEWAGLHPVIRSSEPPRLVSLLLRLIPVLLVMLITINAPKPIFRSSGWWLSACVVLIIAFALLPPLEFFMNAGARQDPNYQQHFQLTIACMITGAIGLSGLFRRLRWILNILIAIVGTICSYHALNEIISAMKWSGLTVTVGVGGIFMIMLFVALAIYSTMRMGYELKTLTHPHSV